MNTLNSAPINAYPLSSERGEAIPLTVVRPIAGQVLPVGESTLVIPESLRSADTNLISLYSEGFFSVQLLNLQGPATAAASEGGWYVDTLMCQPNTLYHVAVGDSFYIYNETHKVTVNLLVKWAQLANLGAYRSL